MVAEVNFRKNFQITDSCYFILCSVTKNITETKQNEENFIL